MPDWVIVAPILVPLVAGVAAYVAASRGRGVAVAVAVLQLPFAAGLAWEVFRGGPLRYALGGWSPPLGIHLYADGLAALMVCMAAVVELGVAVYATQYFGWTERERSALSPQLARGTLFWPLSLLLAGSLNALFLSGDIFNLYVSLELLTLSAVGLIGLASSVDALAAALRYLLIAVVASLFYLLGVTLLYSIYGTVDWQRLGELFEFDFASRCAIVLLVLGLMVKAAIFPLHFWLPAAHGSAPAPASALLSGLVLKAPIFVMLRLWFEVFPHSQLASAGQLLGWLGAAAILWGSLQAIRQRRLKLLVAYSSVAQLGYLFVIFALASNPTVAWSVWSGTIYFVLSHACAKSAAFLAVGSLQLATGGDDIEDVTGSATHHPVTVYAFALAGIGLMGLPPSGGFIAKWLLLRSALESNHWGLVIVILGGGVLAVVYVFRVLSRAFAETSLAPVRQVPRLMQWTPLVLAMVSVGLGLIAIQPLELLRVGAPFAPAASEAPPAVFVPPFGDSAVDAANGWLPEGPPG